jgi:hypothetical protein
LLPIKDAFARPDKIGTTLVHVPRSTTSPGIR